MGEHEGHESFLWVVSVDAGVAGGGPATGAVGEAAVAAAHGGAPAREGERGQARESRWEVRNRPWGLARVEKGRKWSSAWRS